MLFFFFLLSFFILYIIFFSGVRAVRKRESMVMVLNIKYGTFFKSFRQSGGDKFCVYFIYWAFKGMLGGMALKVWRPSIFCLYISCGRRTKEKNETFFCCRLNTWLIGMHDFYCCWIYMHRNFLFYFSGNFIGSTNNFGQ